MAVKQISGNSRREAQVSLMKEIIRSLNSGMPLLELEEKRNLLVAPGWTVGELIQASIDMGSIQVIEDNLVLTSKI